MTKLFFFMIIHTPFYKMHFNLCTLKVALYKLLYILS